MRKAITVSLLTLLVMAGCSNFFQNKVPLQREANPGSPSDLFLTGSDENITSLAAPTGFKISDSTSREIRLSWNGVKGAAAYEIERAWDDGAGAAPGDDDFMVLDEVTGHSYQDTILANPRYDAQEYSRRYWYRVRALNEGRGLAPGSFTTPGDGGLFRPPRDVKTESVTGETKITVKWA
ncbi:MAG: fibronectin type III domain-containing protein, partial [Treponema sp.]|nr:fibronectin type III domain-containing protein [Treponema sp.]